MTMLTLTCFGQLNPIKNLTFSKWYVNPHNCYDLSWTKPDSSLTDILIGYNVYRNDSLYKFTTLTYQHCVPCIGDTNVTECVFMSYSSPSFYIHVTAVYNSSHIESIYNDSAHFLGMTTGTNEAKDKFSYSISPNPFASSTNLTSNLVDLTVTIYNLCGQPVKQVKTNSKQTVINRDNLPSGLYFLRVTKDNKTVASDKLVIVDN